jgi:hypothetical protein
MTDVVEDYKEWLSIKVSKPELTVGSIYDEDFRDKSWQRASQE